MSTTTVASPDTVLTTSPASAVTADEARRALPAPEPFERYAARAAEFAHIERDSEGVVTLTLHTDGGTFSPSAAAHRAMLLLWADLSRDVANKVILITGAGDRFSRRTPAAEEEYRWTFDWARERDRFLLNFAELRPLVIASVNGPAAGWAELLGLCDLVLLSPDAVIEGDAGLARGHAPTDGAHIIWPMLLGLLRAKQFLLLDVALEPDEAVRLGAANEVVRGRPVMERARELARGFAARPTLSLYYARDALLARRRAALLADLQGGIALGQAARAAPNAPPAAPMRRLADYASAYDMFRMERDKDGVLTVRLHSGDGPWVFPLSAFGQVNRLFADVYADPENRAMIITGTGDVFGKDGDLARILPFFGDARPADVDYFYRNVGALCGGPRLDIPLVLALNGPANLHEEWFRSADVILAAPHTTLLDLNHIVTGNPPAGTFIYWDELVRSGRAKAWTVAGTDVSAEEAQTWGAVTEIVPADQLMPRAHAIATRLASVPRPAMRAARLALNTPLRRRTGIEGWVGGAAIQLALIDQGGPFATPAPHTPAGVAR